MRFKMPSFKVGFPILVLACWGSLMFLTVNPPSPAPPACWNHEVTGQLFCGTVLEHEILPDGQYTVADMETYGPGSGATVIQHHAGKFRDFRFYVWNMGRTPNWPEGTVVGDRFRVFQGRAYKLRPLFFI